MMNFFVITKQCSSHLVTPPFLVSPAHTPFTVITQPVSLCSSLCSHSLRIHTSLFSPIVPVRSSVVGPQPKSPAVPVLFPVFFPWTRITFLSPASACFLSSPLAIPACFHLPGLFARRFTRIN